MPGFQTSVWPVTVLTHGQLHSGMLRCTAGVIDAVAMLYDQ